MTAVLVRRLGVVYGVAAVGLVPWIVVLAVSQRRTGVAHRLTIVVPLSVAAVVAGILGTALLVRRRSPHARIAAAYTATSAFVVSWFHIVTGSAATDPADLIVPALLLAVVVAVAAVLATREARGVGAWDPRRFWAAGGRMILVVALCAVAVRLARLDPSVHAAAHLRLAWVGLDMFELTALAWTSYTLLVGSRFTALAAVMTATLLAWDAWFNIAPTAGATQTDGIAMAFVEIPLTLLSAAVAYTAPARNGTNNDVDIAAAAAG